MRINLSLSLGHVANLITIALGFTTPADVALSELDSEAPSAPLSHTIKPVSGPYPLRHVFLGWASSSDENEDERAVEAGDLQRPSFENQDYTPEQPFDPGEGKADSEMTNEESLAGLPSAWGTVGTSLGKGLAD